MSSSTRPSGYPVPSARSCAARTIGAMFARVGAAAMMRSPITLCRFMNISSAGSSGPALSRISAGIATLPTSCSSAARRVSSTCSAGSPSSEAVRAASDATCSRWATSASSCSASTCRSASRTSRPRCRVMRALVGVQVLVGLVERLLERDAGEDARRAARAADRESVALLAQRLLGDAEQLFAALDRRDDDELVAADAVGTAAVADGDSQLAGQAAQQRVAGGMAERVVVGLESVEVEDAEGDRLVAAERTDHALDVGEQLAAVAETGQRVGGRIEMAAATRPHRVEEGDREGRQQEHDGEDGADRGHGPRPGGVGAVPGVGPGVLEREARLEAPGLLAGAQIERRLLRVAGGHLGRQAVDEGEVVAAERPDPNRRLAVPEPGERRDRAAEDALRLGQPDLRLHGCGPGRGEGGIEGDREQLALLVVHLGDDDLCTPRLVHPALELHDRGQRQESEHPHARKQRRGAAERGDPVAPSGAAAVETDGRGVDERVGGAWHGLSLSQMPVCRPHRKQGSDRDIHRPMAGILECARFRRRAYASPMQPDEARSRFAATPVARLATVGDDGRPHLVPVCFAVLGERIVTAVDHKPKRTSRLRRLAEHRAEPRRVPARRRLRPGRLDGPLVGPRRRHCAACRRRRAGSAAAIDALVERYPQYRVTRPEGPVIEIAVTRWSGWSAAG